MRFLFCAVDGAQGINGQNQFVHTTDWTQSFEDWLKEDQQTISNYKTPELLTTVIRDFATDTGRTIDQKLISTFVEKQFSANAAADTAQGVGGAQGTAAYLTSNMENPELKEKTQATLDNIQNILNQKPVDTQELKAELKTLAGQLGFSGGMQDYLSTYLDKLSDRSIIDLCTAKLNGGTLIGKLDSVVFEHIDGLSERQIYQELAWYSDIKNPDRINTADPEEIKRLVERLLESKLESGKITPENIEKFKANFQTLVTAALEEFSKGDRTALTKFAALLCSKEATDGLINELCTRDPVTFANKMNAGVSRGRTSYDLVITSLIKGIVAGQIGEDVLRHYMDDNKYMVTANIFIRVMSNPNFERLSPEGKAVALMGGDGQKTSPDFSALPEADQKILAEMFPEIQAYRKESQEQFEYEVRTGERNLSEEDNDFLVEKAERDAENQEADAAFFDQEPYKSKFPGLGDVFRNAAAQSRAFGNNIVDAFNTQRQIKNQQERQVAGLDSAAQPTISSAGGGGIYRYIWWYEFVHRHAA
jgi:hypothetical protein